MVRTLSNGSWSQTEEVTRRPGDLFRCSLAADGDGNLWAFWSEREGTAWSIWGRQKKGNQWQAPVKVSGEGSNTFHRAVASADGTVFVAWQSFRGAAGKAQSDIYLRAYANGSWGDEVQLSTSPANDWEPAVAAAPDGTAYVAWDGYDKGNYDVFMRSYKGGTLGDLQAVTSNARFQAHASVAVDPDGRPWLAWDESGANWGKDQGFLITPPYGVPLHQERSVRVAMWDGQQWQEPKAKIAEFYVYRLFPNFENPQITFDGKGTLTMVFRHWTRLTARSIGSRLRWENFITRFDGKSWSRPVAVAHSQGSIEKRPALTRDSDGNIASAWMTDNREFVEGKPKNAEIYAANFGAFLGGSLLWRRGVRSVRRSICGRGADPSQRKGKRKNDSRLHDLGRRQEIQDLPRRHAPPHGRFAGLQIRWLAARGLSLRAGRGRVRLHRADRSSIGVRPGIHLVAGRETDRPVPRARDLHADVWIRAQSDLPERASQYYPSEARHPPVTDSRRDEARGEVGAAKLYAYLHKNNGISMPHSSGTAQGTDFRDNDPEVEPLLEIFQGYRASYEYLGAPLAASPRKLREQRSGFNPLGYWWDALRKGYKMGVQASSDHWSTHISYACILAEEFTRESMFEALKKRHAYGATDNIVLDFQAEVDGKSYIMGDIINSRSAPKLKIRAIGTDRIKQVVIVKNQEFVYTGHPNSDETTFEFVDRDFVPGSNYYYLRVVQNNNMVAWSSPIWVE